MSTPIDFSTPHPPPFIIPFRFTGNNNNNNDIVLRRSNQIVCSISLKQRGSYTFFEDNEYINNEAEHATTPFGYLLWVHKKVQGVIENICILSKKFNFAR